MPNTDELLQMALVGFRREREVIQRKIDEIEKRLGGRRIVSRDGGVSTARQRNFSPEALERIKAGVRKRWQEYRKQHGTTPKKSAPTKAVAKKAATAKPRRKLSPAARANLAANLAKARAAKAAKKTAGEKVSS